MISFPSKLSRDGSRESERRSLYCHVLHTHTIHVLNFISPEMSQCQAICIFIFLAVPPPFLYFIFIALNYFLKVKWRKNNDVRVYKLVTGAKQTREEDGKKRKKWPATYPTRCHTGRYTESKVGHVLAHHASMKRQMVAGKVWFDLLQSPNNNVK